MLEAAGIFGLLALWLLGGGGGSAPARPGGGGGAARKQPPQLPAGQQTSAPPWPQAVPAGLPPFPGAGWQYDEPPPAAVVQRAGQLVSQLWSGGAGTFKIEQTAGRWIAYRAEKVKSGKNGVVAYRVKGTAAAKPTTNTKDRAQTSSSAQPSLAQSLLTLAQILSSTVPAPSGASVFHSKAGHWYQWSALGDGPPGAAPAIVAGLKLSGAVNIACSDTPPYAIGFQIQAQRDTDTPINVWISVNMEDGRTWRIMFLRVQEIQPPQYGPPPPPAPPAPAKPKPEPPTDAGPILAAVAPSAPAMRTLPTLRRGDGIKPKPPNDDVKLMQRKLGVAADGQFGGGTETALKNYQRSHALTPDGVCGPKTWTSLLAGF